MKKRTIRVAMPDDVYQRLKKRAKDAGYVGIAPFLLAKVGEHNKHVDAATIVTKALNRAAKALEKGDTFLVKDLVSDWTEIDPGVRIMVGKHFYERVNSEGKDFDIRAGNKGSSGHQTYIKIK